VEPQACAGQPRYDPDCYLCPGNPRAGGARNPDYRGVFVFDNDFPALLDDAPRRSEEGPAWKVGREERGICRVICYSPRHDLTLGELDRAGVRGVVDAWVEQSRELISRPAIGHVQIFENRGEAMGCSNPHPHGQIWAGGEVPNEPAKEDLRQAEYKNEHGKCLLCEVLAYEMECAERVVCQNGAWLVAVPFWAAWPFETLVVPKRHAAGLAALSEEEKDLLVDIWRRLLGSYDRLFSTVMPFSFGWHQVPKMSADLDAWHLHAHFYPPLLRSAAVRKFMVGYEMLGEPQRDITPEQAAEHLCHVADSMGA
jgi:UDPglucose--hexose-1-phosphate uridylyltransferase